MDVLYSSPACDGHRQGLEWVGAGGMRWCFLHANVFGKLAAAQQRIQQLEAMTPFGEDFKTLAEQEAAEYTTIATTALKGVPITCPEPARFVLQDHDTLITSRLVAM